jgi:hypothetical protein
VAVQYRVIKVMYEPGELESLIAAEGWTVGIEATRWFNLVQPVNAESRVPPFGYEHATEERNALLA